jgi:hypothetical protein
MSNGEVPMGERRNSQRRAPEQRVGRFDARIGRTVVDVQGGVHAVRGLRSSIVEMALALMQAPELTGLLVLVDPNITHERLEQERRLVELLIVPEVRDRLHIVTAEKSGYSSLPHALDERVRSKLDALVRAERNRLVHRIGRPDYAFLIKQILILSWLRGKGPLTADWICATTGCTYPTFATAVRPLGSLMKRASDRSYELARFPREEWARMVATSTKARNTIRFADTSGQPRTPEALVKRLGASAGPTIAVGGVLGARHLDPELDLVGTPRLDLTVHCPDAMPDMSFIERIDPALRRIDDPHQPAHIAIHFLRRAEPLFEATNDQHGGLHAWADPVECLLDLHEARLDGQAEEFLAQLLKRRTEGTRG